ncbi:MAG TPA: hypothetical protein VMX17_10000 [Candidatus Glassbacteria bacterium]|nr:hypothetical protein [Candidatus Glassbacteria bacterium]
MKETKINNFISIKFNYNNLLKEQMMPIVICWDDWRHQYFLHMLKFATLEDKPTEEGYKKDGCCFSIPMAKPPKLSREFVYWSARPRGDKCHSR